MRGELGNNEQMMYRALAVFNHMAVLHDLAFDAARSLLGQEKVDAQLSGYLDELQRFSLLRKMSVLSMEEHFIEKFSYDFCALLTQGFADDPKNYFRDDGVRLAIAHSAEQQRLIKEYIALYGLDTYGLGSILGSQTNVNSFYRQVEYS
jgi:hypothetical protein